MNGVRVFRPLKKDWGGGGGEGREDGHKRENENMLVLLMPYAGSTGVVYKERVSTRRQWREPEETRGNQREAEGSRGKQREAEETRRDERGSEETRGDQLRQASVAL